uniref:HYDIN/VesB/CFA65-like Ig-like domain-containing protein n=1 Tax=Malurus cyaneus samueli TaxID=2593467 RepID=A0A8C5X0M5_9PASS
MGTACLCFHHFWQADCYNLLVILPCCFTAHLNSLCNLLIAGIVFPSHQALPYCPWLSCWTQREGMQVHPCELCACASTAESALEKRSRKDVTRARSGLLSSCFPRWQNHCFISFLQAPQTVKVSMESSPCFQLMCSNEVDGIKCSVLSQFLFPQNYVHQLLCTTARERIVVPLRAVATRGNLDLPTHLDFQLCVVNCKTQKTLVVCNTGTREARFCLSTEGPFSVVPAKGVLGIGNTMEVTVAFYPPRSGEHSGGLLVSYNTGESLRGDAKDVDIVFSTNCADFGKAFVTLSWPMTVTIENRSGITASFQWKRFPTLEEDNMERKRLVGEVGPYSSVEIKVTFLPVKSIQYRTIAYCDISGREIRVPLTIKGEGRGPWAVPSYHTLELGKILVNTPHVYEVKLINKGPIEAPFAIISEKTNVGNEFKFVPKHGVIAVGEAKTIQIFFRANQARQMAERYLFSMIGCPEAECLTIRGHVMEPCFALTEKDLHYGKISFGFPETKKFDAISLNPVSVKFKFRMSEDGSQPSVHAEQMTDNADPSWTKGLQFQGGPQEFVMTPSEGLIHPGERITVTVCSNTVTDYNRLLFLDVVNIRDAVAHVVITARYQHFPGHPPAHCLA